MSLADHAALRNRPHVSPHGCWLIVAQALEEVHGVRLPRDWGAELAEDDILGRALLLELHLAEHGRVVETPAAGDVIACCRAGRPIHVALATGAGYALQSTSLIGASHFVTVFHLQRQYSALVYHRPLKLMEETRCPTS